MGRESETLSYLLSRMNIVTRTCSAHVHLDIQTTLNAVGDERELARRQVNHVHASSTARY